MKNYEVWKNFINTSRRASGAQRSVKRHCLPTAGSARSHVIVMNASPCVDMEVSSPHTIKQDRSKSNLSLDSVWNARGLLILRQILEDVATKPPGRVKGFSKISSMPSWEICSFGLQLMQYKLQKTGGCCKSFVSKSSTPNYLTVLWQNDLNSKLLQHTKKAPH